MAQKTYFSLPIILLLALLLRLLLPVAAHVTTHDSRVFSTPDTASYLSPAYEMLKRGTFTRNGRPEIKRTPGYPAFLLPGLMTGKTYHLTIVLQIVLSTLTVCLVYLIARQLFATAPTARLAAAAFALEPLSILYASKISTETLFTFFLALGTYVLVRHVTERSRVWCVLGALCISAAAYVRPIGYYLPPCLFLVLVAVAVFRHRDQVHGLIAAMMFLGFSSVLLFAWQMRNVEVAEYPGFAGIQDQNLYFYHAASVLAAHEGRSYYEVQKEMGYGDDDLFLERHPAIRGASEARLYLYKRDEAARIIRQHPALFAKLHIAGMARMMLDPGATDYLKLYKAYPRKGGLLGRLVDDGPVATLLWLLKERPLVFWSNVALGILLAAYWLFAAVGCLQPFRDRPAVLLLLGGILLYLLVLSGGASAHSRFRAPMMPIICVLAAAGVGRLSTFSFNKED